MVVIRAMKITFRIDVFFTKKYQEKQELSGRLDWGGQSDLDKGASKECEQLCVDGRDHSITPTSIEPI